LSEYVSFVKFTLGFMYVLKVTGRARTDGGSYARQRNQAWTVRMCVALASQKGSGKAPIGRLVNLRS
jgi:hypothetical protein